MSPEKIAIAVAVTIAAIAGIGAMKNVTGTSSAVAIVAVSPGTRADEQAEQRRQPASRGSLYGSKTSRRPAAQARPWQVSTAQAALQHAPGQRHLQQLVERVVDDQRRDHARRQRRSTAHAQHDEQHAQSRRRDDQEAEPIDGQDVEHD